MMGRILTKEDLIEFQSEMIIQAMEDYRSFEDAESRRTFMNSISQACNNLKSSIKSDILDELRAEVDKLKELAGI